MEVGTPKVGAALIGLICIKDISTTAVKESQAIEGLSPFPGKIELFTFAQGLFQVLLGGLPVVLFQVHPATCAQGNSQASTPTGLLSDSDRSLTVYLLYLYIFTRDYKKFSQ